MSCTNKKEEEEEREERGAEMTTEQAKKFSYCLRVLKSHSTLVFEVGKSSEEEIKGVRSVLTTLFMNDYLFLLVARHHLPDFLKGIHFSLSEQLQHLKTTYHFGTVTQQNVPIHGPDIQPLTFALHLLQRIAARSPPATRLIVKMKFVPLLLDLTLDHPLTDIASTATEILRYCCAYSTHCAIQIMAMGKFPSLLSLFLESQGDHPRIALTCLAQMISNFLVNECARSFLYQLLEESHIIAFKNFCESKKIELAMPSAISLSFILLAPRIHRYAKQLGGAEAVKKFLSFDPYSSPTILNPTLVTTVDASLIFDFVYSDSDLMQGVGLFYMARFSRRGVLYNLSHSGTDYNAQIRASICSSYILSVRKAFVSLSPYAKFAEMVLHNCGDPFYLEHRDLSVWMEERVAPGLGGSKGVKQVVKILSGEEISLNLMLGGEIEDVRALLLKAGLKGGACLAILSALRKSKLWLEGSLKGCDIDDAHGSEIPKADVDLLKRSDVDVTDVKEYGEEEESEFDGGGVDDGKKKGKGKGKGEKKKMKCQKKKGNEIFLSYSWSTKQQCLNIQTLLLAQGYNCWVDEKQMAGGADLFASIDQGIRQARVVVAIVSEGYTTSKNCIREFSLASDLNKMIIPVLVDAIDWPPAGALGPLMTGKLYVKFDQPNDQSVRLLVDAVRKCL